jgi:quinol-cytochrome oxidoreductase complex cytochrome b subunit
MITGITLAMHYNPSSIDLAFSASPNISGENVNMGWFLRSMPR